MCLQVFRKDAGHIVSVIMVHIVVLRLLRHYDLATDLVESRVAYIDSRAYIIGPVSGELGLTVHLDNGRRNLLRCNISSN